MERRKFLGSTIGLAGLAAVGCAANKNANSKSKLNAIQLKGKSDSLITHWDIVTIGNLSRNRY